MYRHHKVPLGVTFSLRNLLNTLRVNVLLILCIRETLCDVYICQESHYVGVVDIIGWFSNRTGTSDDDGRARGMVWILF